MRQSTRLVVLALAAVFAFSVVGVTSASAALPKFKVYPQTFTGEAVEHEGSGSKDLKLTTSAGDEPACAALTLKGEITGEQTVKVVFDFTTCKLTKPVSSECKNTSNAGEISVTVLGKLGFDSPDAEPEDSAILLEPKELSFTCVGGLETVKISRSFICFIKPANVSTTSLKVVCSTAKNADDEPVSGEQEHKLFYNEDGELLSEDYLLFEATGIDPIKSELAALLTTILLHTLPGEENEIEA